MANPVTLKTDILDMWRLNLNTVGNNVGDPISLYSSDGTDTFNLPVSNIVITSLNDLNSRKVKRSGDTIASLIVTGALNGSAATFSGLTTSATLTVTGQSTLGSTSITSLTVTGSVGNLTSTGQFISTIVTGTPPFVVASSTPVIGLNSTGNSATATTSNNITGGTVGAVPYQSAIGTTSFLSIGSANRVLGVTTSGTSLEYKLFQSALGSIQITYPSAGVINLEASGTTGATYFAGDITVGSTPTKITLAYLTGNMTTVGTLTVGGASQLANITVGASKLTIDSTNGNLSSAGSLTAVSGNISGAFTISTANLTTANISGTTTFGNITDLQVATLTTTSISSGQVIGSYPTSVYRSVELIIQAVDSTALKYHSVTIKAVHDGTNVSFTEYAATATANGLCGTFSVIISAGSLELVVTPSTTNSTVFKVSAILTRI